MNFDLRFLGSRGSARICSVNLLVFMFVLTAATQNAPTAPKAGSVYKNLRLLQDLPASEIVPSMRFISSSLGVGCSHCHVENAFDKDDKKPKQTARKMIEMVRNINGNSFSGAREVTCYSCHHGGAKVASIPAVGPASASGEKENSAPAASANVDQIWQRYLQAVGGADALQKSTTHVEKGTATIGTRQFPVEAFSQSPDKRTVIMHLPNGDSITVFDGNSGWVADPGREVRPMTPGEVDAARLDAALQFPRALAQWGFELRTAAPETVSDKSTDVVSVRAHDQPIGKLYFDPQSGLLVRAVRYANTPLGENPTQVDYSDYREEHGTKIPFKLTTSRPGGGYTVQLESVQLNTAIDSRRFQMPEAPKRAQSSSQR
jgi:photosynthetic reaction center cytochrome c subunit